MADSTSFSPLKPRYLFLDTETSGLFVKEPKGTPPVPADDPSQPHLARAAMIRVDDRLVIESELDVFVRRDGWSMQPGATAVNGITDEMLDERGRPVAEALTPYCEAVDNGRIVVTFAAQFDTKVMRGALRRFGWSDRFHETKNICVMRWAAAVLKNGRFYIKLEEALSLLGLPQGQPHQPLDDARGALEIFRALVARGEAVPEPEVRTNRRYVDGTRPAAPIPALPDPATGRVAPTFRVEESGPPVPD